MSFKKDMKEANYTYLYKLIFTNFEPNYAQILILEHIFNFIGTTLFIALKKVVFITKR